MGSVRSPGKVLADICGKPLLGRLIDRMAAVPGIGALVVATTNKPEDDELAAWVKNQMGVPCFRGSTLDVLDRFYQCARKYQADRIVRLTGDDPLKDPAIVQEALALIEEDLNLDYCSNTVYPTYPEGLDVEVFRFRALEQAHSNARLKSEREHVTPYIWKHPELFRLKNFSYHKDLSAWRWTVDNPSDLEFMRLIYEHFRNDPLVSFEDVITYLEQNPNIALINSGALRNESYLNSIKLDAE